MNALEKTPPSTLITMKSQIEILASPVADDTALAAIPRNNDIMNVSNVVA